MKLKVFETPKRGQQPGQLPTIKFTKAYVYINTPMIKRLGIDGNSHIEYHDNEDVPGEVFVSFPKKEGQNTKKLSANKTSTAVTSSNPLSGREDIKFGTYDLAPPCDETGMPLAPDSVKTKYYKLILIAEKEKGESS